jgi:hypothetical protein
MVNSRSKARPWKAHRAKVIRHDLSRDKFGKSGDGVSLYDKGPHRGPLSFLLLSAPLKGYQKES